MVRTISHFVKVLGYIWVLNVLGLELKRTIELPCFWILDQLRTIHMSQILSLPALLQVDLDMTVFSVPFC